MHVSSDIIVTCIGGFFGMSTKLLYGYSNSISEIKDLMNENVHDTRKNYTLVEKINDDVQEIKVEVKEIRENVNKNTIRIAVLEKNEWAWEKNYYWGVRKHEKFKSKGNWIYGSGIINVIIIIIRIN